MAIRLALTAALFATVSGCAASYTMQPTIGPLAEFETTLAERTVSLYTDHQAILVPARAPTTSLGVEAPDSLHIRAIVVTYTNGDRVTVTDTTHGRVRLPAPPRQLQEVELLYASDAPPDTYARIRLVDLSARDALDALEPPDVTARR